jgi:hypothetical protein
MFAVGNRVILSEEGMKTHPLAYKNPQRVGTVVRICGRGWPVVHWDGNKVACGYGLPPTSLTLIPTVADDDIEEVLEDERGEAEYARKTGEYFCTVCGGTDHTWRRCPDNL